MTNIKDISDSPLNRLHDQLTNTLLEVREHCTSQAVTYRSMLSPSDSLQYTMTLTYVTCMLTSGLAKLYMLLGHTKGELTAEELQGHLKDINNDMIKKDSNMMYMRHTGVNNFVAQAEDLNTRIDHISKGGVYYAEEGK